MRKQAIPLTTNVVTMTFTGPVVLEQEALAAMQKLGFRVGEREPSGEKSHSRHETLLFQEMDLPGIFLSGARYRSELTQEELARRTGILRRHISEMENGKRPVSKQQARKLAEVLGIELWRLLA